MVWSFVYLALRRVLALMVLCWQSADAKEVEILVLRHQHPRARLQPQDRALLAALSRRLPRRRWSIFVVALETLLGWHRRMVRRRWTSPALPSGRPPIPDWAQTLIVRLATENPRWGYQRIRGELLHLGFRASGSSIARVLRANGLQPAPRPAARSTTWRLFLRRQAAGIVACLFLTMDTVFLQRLYVLFFIQLHNPARASSRRHRHPTGAWVAQQARNLVAALDEETIAVRFLICDRESKFTRAFDELHRNHAPERSARMPDGVISKASETLLREAADAHARMGKPVAEGGSAVNPVERALRGIVRYEQRQSWLGFPFGVVKKFGDDKGGALTTLLA